MYLSKSTIVIIILTIIAVSSSFVVPYVSLTMLTLMVAFLLYRSFQPAKNTSAPSISISDYKVADTVMLINPHGVIQDCNSQIFPMFGYTPDEAIGKPIEFLMDPSLQVEHVSLRDRFFITSGKRRMQNRVWGVHKEGHRVHIEIHLEITSIGSQANVICSIRNIETFWRREKELQLENQILKTTQDGLIGFVHSTLGGQIILSNNFLSSLLAYSSDELKSMSIKDLIHYRNLEDISKAKIQLIEGVNDSYSLNVQLVSSRGHSVAANIKMKLVENDDEDFISWTITDRTTEVALLRKADHLSTEVEALINNLPDKTAVWVSSPGMSNISRSNTLFHKIWGTTVEEIQSNPRAFLSRVNKDDRPKVMEIYQGHLSSGWQLNYQMTSDSGIVYQVNETAKLVPEENNVGHLICFQKFNPV